MRTWDGRWVFVWPGAKPLALVQKSNSSPPTPARLCKLVYSEEESCWGNIEGWLVEWLDEPGMLHYRAVKVKNKLGRKA